MHYYKWDRPEGATRPPGLDAIEDLEGVQAWTGPDGNPDKVIEDSVMGRKFPVMVRDLSRSYGIDPKSDGTLFQAVGCPFRTYISALPQVDDVILQDSEQDFARIVQLPGNETYATVFAALVRGMDDDWRVRGLILDCDIAVDPIDRNLGLGSALVAAQLLTEGGLQVWEHDKHGYTTGGKACVSRGLLLAQRLSEPFREQMPGPV